MSLPGPSIREAEEEYQKLTAAFTDPADREAADEVAREQRGLDADPEEERTELELFYQLKGVSPATADSLSACPHPSTARQLSGLTCGGSRRFQGIRAHRRLAWPLM